MVLASQEDSKFAHLLEPIRDLASNWNVNIADELEDYLVRPFMARPLSLTQRQRLVLPTVW